jgi:hypothetical protein
MAAAAYPYLPVSSLLRGMYIFVWSNNKQGC